MGGGGGTIRRGKFIRDVASNTILTAYSGRLLDKRRFTVHALRDDLFTRVHSLRASN